MKNTELYRQPLARKLPIGACLLFFAFSAVFAQTTQNPAAPDFKAKTFPNGILYTFSCPENAVIKYKLFEPLSGSYAEGNAADGESVFILNGITGAVWTETKEGKSLPAVLYPQAEQPFADIDSAFISPAEGEWANKQPLVIDIPADYEAYYSLTSTDPFVSGLAYDGPVFIDMNGTITVHIALVAPDGSSFNKSITYTVADYASFQPITSASAVIECGPQKPLSIPPSMRYRFGDAEKAFQPGTKLAPRRQSDILRYVPLVIMDGNEKYRYVVQTGEPSGGVKPIPPVTGIMFYDWNYFAFDIGSAVSYSIDGSPWMLYTDPVHIDRTKPHTVTWSSPAYLSGQVQLLKLPPKPQLTGLPANGITNNSVTVSLNNQDFVLRHETAKHKSDFLHSVFFDVLPGETYAYNTDLAVYYNGVRQGTISARFTIDKEPAVSPVLITGDGTPAENNENGYSQKPIELRVDDPQEVFIRIAEKPVALTAGDFPDFLQLPPPKPGLEGFVPAEKEFILLPGSEKSAVLYRLEAYRRNKAGNISPVVSWTVCIDLATIFASANREGTTGKGSGAPFDPFISFEDALSEANSRAVSKIIVSGTFSGLSGFSINRSCEINGENTKQTDQKGRLEFTPGSVVTVNDGAKLTLKSLTLTQEQTADQPVRRSLFETMGSSLVFDGCEVRVSGGDSRSLVYANRSSVFITDSKLSVSSDSYCALVEAAESSVTADNSQLFGAASAAELFTVSGGNFTLNKSECTVSAAVGRIAGLSGTMYSVTANLFSQTGANGKSKLQAIQANQFCTEKAFSGNSVSGFNPGILKIR